MSENKSSMKSLITDEKIRMMIIKDQKLPGIQLIIADMDKELGIVGGHLGGSHAIGPLEHCEKYSI